MSFNSNELHALRTVGDGFAPTARTTVREVQLPFDYPKTVNDSSSLLLTPLLYSVGGAIRYQREVNSIGIREQTIT
jgi:hypothetical protein